MREVRISCPDATGLGVDLTRVLLDFGLRILQGDISTDGKWCFMVFRVQLSSGVPPRWQLLRARLGSMCPNGTAALDALWRWRSLPKEHPPFLLQVASYDRQGMLHSLTHVLWESDATVRQGGGGEGWRGRCKGMEEGYWEVSVENGDGEYLRRLPGGPLACSLRLAIACPSMPSPTLPHQLSP